MRSLAFKLTLAFLLIGLTGAVLVAVIVRARTRSAFDQFLLNRDQQTLVENLVEYYQVNGSWAGVTAYLPAISNLPMRPGRGSREMNRQWGSFTLIGPDRTIVYSLLANQIGGHASEDDLVRAIPLQVNGAPAGWVLLSSSVSALLPDSPEGTFLQNVNSAVFLSAVIAALLALTLGSVLAFTLTRSIRELKEATVEIAQGRLGLQVKVRSRDELGELAASFNQMSLDLQRATQARRQMTADIAHELRSPLSVIAGYAEALNDGKLPGAPEIYAILYQETRHINRLVEDLRTLSLADAGELPLALQPVNPQIVLERVAARHAMTASQKGVTLRVLPTEILPDLTMDVERMCQVLDNLVLNAFRYTPQGGEITLSIQVTPTGVQMIVQDTGSGIAPDDLPYIFDRFYRGDKARQANGESGLGLAIARSIVAAHHGALAAENIPDHGARFTITLPKST